MNRYIISFLFIGFLCAQTSDQSHYLISYNIRYHNDWDTQNSWSLRKNKICQLLEEYDPSIFGIQEGLLSCLLYTSPSPRDTERSRMPSSA